MLKGLTGVPSEGRSYVVSTDTLVGVTVGFRLKMECSDHALKPHQYSHLGSRDGLSISRELFKSIIIAISMYGEGKSIKTNENNKTVY